jgi:regulator of RNase E activity RraA
VTIVIGGVRVAPGDWIDRDRDGVVVVPGERVEELLAQADAKVATENEIRDSSARACGRWTPTSASARSERKAPLERRVVAGVRSHLASL